MSVTVTPPTALDSGESAETKLKTTLARLQGGSGLRIQSTGNETCGQHTIAWAACASKASDGRSVGQLIAVVGNERLTVGFSGSVALADFPRTQATLWEILRSIKLDP